MSNQPVPATARQMYRFSGAFLAVGLVLLFIGAVSDKARAWWDDVPVVAAVGFMLVSLAAGMSYATRWMLAARDAEIKQNVNDASGT